jgi:hypothetical protein
MAIAFHYGVLVGIQFQYIYIFDINALQTFHSHWSILIIVCFSGARVVRSLVF